MTIRDLRLLTAPLPDDAPISPGVEFSLRFGMRADGTEGTVDEAMRGELLTGLHVCVSE